MGLLNIFGRKETQIDRQVSKARKAPEEEPKSDERVRLEGELERLGISWDNLNACVGSKMFIEVAERNDMPRFPDILAQYPVLIPAYLEAFERARREDAVPVTPEERLDYAASYVSLTLRAALDKKLMPESVKERDQLVRERTKTLYAILLTTMRVTGSVASTTA